MTLIVYSYSFIDLYKSSHGNQPTRHVRNVANTADSKALIRIVSSAPFGYALWPKSNPIYPKINSAYQHPAVTIIAVSIGVTDITDTSTLLISRTTQPLIRLQTPASPCRGWHTPCRQSRRSASSFHPPIFMLGGRGRPVKSLIKFSTFFNCASVNMSSSSSSSSSWIFSISTSIISFLLILTPRCQLATAENTAQ